MRGSARDTEPVLGSEAAARLLYLVTPKASLCLHIGGSLTALWQAISAPEELREIVVKVSNLPFSRGCR